MSESKGGSTGESGAKPHDAAKGDAPRHFDATLPIGKPGQSAQVRRAADGELDLDLGEIQTRLPYGSEDIADK